MPATSPPRLLAPACPVTLKSLADFFEQKTRLHRQAFALAERPGLEGNLSKRLYYLLLLCQRYEAQHRRQLQAAGRPLDTTGSQLVAERQQAFRKRHAITRLRPAPLEEIQAVGYPSFAEADAQALGAALGVLA